MGLRAPRGVIELCVALFAFILICNWLAALPTEHYLPPPTADVNLVYPLALLVIVWVNVAGIRANGRRRATSGTWPSRTSRWPRSSSSRSTSPGPVSLALRLFGNIFAGGIMVAVIALLPAYIRGCRTRRGSCSTCSSA